MVSSRMYEPQRMSGDKATVDRLFLLDLSDDCVVSLNPDVVTAAWTALFWTGSISLRRRGISAS